MSAIALPAEAPILIVDDEFLVLWGLQDALEKMGFQTIVTAASARAGREAMMKNDLEFAFLDINLGHEKSFDLARDLKAAGVPFAFVTGYGRSRLNGAFDEVAVLSKPVDPAALAKTVAVID